MGNPYIDDEAIESDDEDGQEHYTAEDLAFINDEDDEDVEAEPERPTPHRASAKPSLKARSDSSKSSSLALKEHVPESSVSKRSEISSDDFDGIESVEEELSEVTNNKLARHPLLPSKNSGLLHKVSSSLKRHDQLDHHELMEDDSPDWEPRDSGIYANSQTPSLETRTQLAGDVPPNGHVTDIGVSNDNFRDWIDHHEHSEEEPDHGLHGHSTVRRGDGSRGVDRRLAMDGESTLVLACIPALKGLVDDDMKFDKSSSPPVRDTRQATNLEDQYESGSDWSRYGYAPPGNGDPKASLERSEPYEYSKDEETPVDRDEYYQDEVVRNGDSDRWTSDRPGEQTSRHQGHAQHAYEDRWQRGELSGLVE